MRNQFKGPFRVLPRKVRISVTNSPNILNDTAVVCANGDFFKQTLLLSTDNGMVKIGAWHTRIHESCARSTEDDYIPLIQINENTARILLPNGSFTNQDYGFAVILPTEIVINEADRRSAFQNVSLENIAFHSQR